MPDLEWLAVNDRRNLVASVASGILFFVGWWLAIDAAACYTDKTDLKDVFHICGVFGTVSMLMVNAVSNRQLRGEGYEYGCLGVNGVRIWFFFGFLMGFGSLIGAAWILFGEYVSNTNFNPKTTYPGVAIFLQNACIFFASIIYKFGRSDTENTWG